MEMLADRNWRDGLADVDAVLDNGVAGSQLLDRELVAELLTRRDTIDVVIPRGGDGLIQFVTENSRIPIIKNDRGMCHV